MNQNIHTDHKRNLNYINENLAQEELECWLCLLKMQILSPMVCIILNQEGKSISISILSFDVGEIQIKIPNRQFKKYKYKYKYNILNQFPYQSFLWCWDWRKSVVQVIENHQYEWTLDHRYIDASPRTMTLTKTRTKSVSKSMNTEQEFCTLVIWRNMGEICNNWSRFSDLDWSLYSPVSPSFVKLELVVWECFYQSCCKWCQKCKNGKNDPILV